EILAVFLPLSLTLAPAHAPHFPYTTLFRSGVGLLRLHVHRLVAVFGIGDHGQVQPLRVRLREARVEIRRPLHRGAHAVAIAEIEDRKSTRLNSSHVKISYAVFCLKNKGMRA